MGRNSSGGGGVRGGATASRAAKLTGDWTSVADGVEIRSLAPPDKNEAATQHDTIEIKIDGRLAGRLQYQIGSDGRVEINDTVLSDQFRGRGTVPKMFPKFERHVKSLGGKYIVANVVDEAVGTRVWAKVGFKPLTEWNGSSQKWRKEI